MTARTSRRTDRPIILRASNLRSAHWKALLIPPAILSAACPRCSTPPTAAWIPRRKGFGSNPKPTSLSGILALRRDYSVLQEVFPLRPRHVHHVSETQRPLSPLHDENCLVDQLQLLYVAVRRGRGYPAWAYYVAPAASSIPE